MKNFFTTLILVTFPICNYCQDTTMNKDWPNLNKYAKENSLLTNTTNSVVFMGDSINEFWKVNNEAFFTSNSYI